MFLSTAAALSQQNRITKRKGTALTYKRLQRTGISVSLIDNLPLAQLSPRPLKPAFGCFTDVTYGLKMDAVTLIGIVLGLMGLVLTTSIAIWQHSEAKKAKAELNGLLQSLPSQVFDNVSRLLQANQPEFSELYGMLNSEKALQSRYADLDVDGKDELLVQYPIGAHGAALQVFGFRDWEFKLIAELSIDTPAGFVAEDVDGDGRLEIVTNEVSQDADFPYVLGFRDEVWYRLENDRFVEVKRTNLYDKKDLEKARRNAEKWLNEGQACFSDRAARSTQRLDGLLLLEVG